MDLEGSGRALFGGTIPGFPLGDWRKSWKLQ